MSTDLFTPDQPAALGRTVMHGTPREYQVIDHDESFRLWDDGTIGTLTRIFTGGGKTVTACMKAATWLNRGPDHHVLVVSYEKQLVWQFAQEIEDFLGITPAIEMDADRIHAERVPSVVVASRASLLCHQGPTPAQLERLHDFGIDDVGACSALRCKSYLRHLEHGGERHIVQADIGEFNALPEVVNDVYSRVHKFDWRLNWLVIFDEAHRHSYRLVSVKHIVDWFDQNPESRRLGMTATPKRGDGVSIGHKMFPDVAIDYPLFHRLKPNAVRDGYAVPYVQKYIEVDGVDFKNLKKIAGDFDKDQLALLLGEEGTLAKLVQPLLDMVGERKTLIFSPGVEMAKNVASFINARSEARCACGLVRWYPTRLIGDGALCPCGRMIDPSDVTKNGEQAKAIWGEIGSKQRKQIYDGHQKGEFQFLSVCGLCREGYNDPDISCVAVFRPVSKKASSLAEQMKGRACRVLRGLIEGMKTAEERLDAIATSSKPNALIVDLVGITGLADCASTIEIYADGLPDEVKEKAEEILLGLGMDEEADVEGAIDQAKREIEEEKERIKEEREEAQRLSRERAAERAKVDAETKYTEHDVGYGSAVDPNGASEKQMNYIAFLGMSIHGRTISKRQAGRMITQLKLRTPLEEVARTNSIQPEHWESVGPTINQIRLMRRRCIPRNRARSKYDASQLIDAAQNPAEYAKKAAADIRLAPNAEELTGVAGRVGVVRDVIGPERFANLLREGKERRRQLNGVSDADESI